jgi:osmotically inducible protein OsmC
MLKAQREVTAVWTGDLVNGAGTVTSGSGAWAEQPVSWAARVESAGGKTSPEELLAAANASCFCMALSGGLGDAGYAPQRLEVTARCTISDESGDLRVRTMELAVKGWVPGIDGAAFTEAANGAGAGCPISKALAGNVTITVEAQLMA